MSYSAHCQQKESETLFLDGLQSSWNVLAYKCMRFHHQPNLSTFKHFYTFTIKHNASTDVVIYRKSFIFRNVRQPTYTCVPLSPCSISRHRPRGVISLAGKVTVGLVESE